MLACLDVHYRGDTGIAAAVFFERWDDARPAHEHVTTVRPVAPYQPGNFYLRELPCLLAVLRDAGHVPTTVVIDGFVWLGTPAAPRPGLGAHLFEALGCDCAVIGVGKSRFAGCELARSLLRGRSRRPLWVTAVGMRLEQASAHIAAMHGASRIPTLLARADRLGRTAGERP